MNLAQELIKIAITLDKLKTYDAEKEHDNLASILAYKLRVLGGQLNAFLEEESKPTKARNFNLKPLERSLAEATESLKELWYSSTHVKYAASEILEQFDMCPKMAPVLDKPGQENLLDISDESKKALRRFRKKLQDKHGDFKITVSKSQHEGVCVVTKDPGSVVTVKVRQNS